MAGLVQGIVLVTFPAASTILTSPGHYGLSSGQYGAMFVPQVALAIAGSLLGARLAARIGAKRVYLLGLTLSLAAMILLLASAPAQARPAAAYPLLLAATAFLGAGFGLTVPVLNTFASDFHPGGVDSAVLALNALLGLGTVLAPVFVAIFVGLGVWWVLPVLAAALLAALLLASARLPLRTTPAVTPAPAATTPAPTTPAATTPAATTPAATTPAATTPAATTPAATTPAGAPGPAGRSRIPARFWLYAAFAVLYGVCETMSGNWSQLEMTRQLGASASQASLALAAFWAMVTAGRVLFAAAGRWVPARLAFRLLPFAVVIAFLLAGSLSRHQAVAGIAVFALAGLGCSAILPLTVSFGEEAMAAMSAAVAGGVIAFYQAGYGIAAFSVGPLQAAGITLPEIFRSTAAVAAVLAALAFFITRPARPAGPAGQPRPARSAPGGGAPATRS
jgi:MFS family permease